MNMEKSDFDSIQDNSLKDTKRDVDSKFKHNTRVQVEYSPSTPWGRRMHAFSISTKWSKTKSASFMVFDMCRHVSKAYTQVSSWYNGPTLTTLSHELTLPKFVTSISDLADLGEEDNKSISLALGTSCNSQTYFHLNKSPIYLTIV